MNVIASEILNEIRNEIPAINKINEKRNNLNNLMVLESIKSNL